MMASKRIKLPSFEKEREEHEFWDYHSVEDFAEEVDELDVIIRSARTMQIALRLSKEDLGTLRAIAEDKGIGHNMQAGDIVEQWLARSRRKSLATASTLYSPA